MTSHGARRRAQPSESERFEFWFDGQPVHAYPTDTVASALIAAGIRQFSSHPADGEPRGGFCFAGRCSDCLVIIDGQPGVMACTTPARPGLDVETQRGLGTWPGGSEA